MGIIDMSNKAFSLRDAVLGSNMNWMEYAVHKKLTTPTYGEYELLADITVSSATTSVDITGLNITSDDEILLVSDVSPNSVDGVNIYLYVNGNNTATNYYMQQITADSTSIGAARENSPRFCGTSQIKKTQANTNIKLMKSGHAVYYSSTADRYNSTVIRIMEYVTTSTFTVSSITSLRISASSLNEVGAGSRFQLYKIGSAS